MSCHGRGVFNESVLTLSRGAAGVVLVRMGIGSVVEFPDGKFSTPIAEEQIAAVLEEM